MFNFRRSTMLQGNPIANFIGHPVVLCTSILVGLAQTAHYLERPATDLPPALEYVALANWMLLLLCSIGYLACASMRAADWATGRSGRGDPPQNRKYDWPWCSLELLAMLTCVAVTWTAVSFARAQPVTDKSIAACAWGLNEAGLQHLGQNLKPSTTPADFRVLCGEAFLKDRIAAPKRPESREELLRQYGPK